MAFICEDVGTTKRRKMTRSRALKIWESRKGICYFCKIKIDATRENWFIEHPRALELGGSDEDSELWPAHYEHKAAKDAADHKAAAKAKRVKANHLGIKDPNARKIPHLKREKPPGKASLPPRPMFREAS